MAGCGSQQSNEVKISKTQLDEYFQKCINNNLELFSKYADSGESKKSSYIRSAAGKVMKDLGLSNVFVGFF